MFSRRSPNPLQDAGACAHEIALLQFIDNTIFETKPGDLGILLSISGIDPLNQTIRIGEDQRQLSRSCLVLRRNSSPSFFESEPPSKSRALRRFCRSASPCKKLSIASPSTAEIPFCPRRDARASKALRCSGFISTVVRIFPSSMHLLARSINEKGRL